MESSFRIFRFRGIDVGANWSWLLVFAFLVFSLYDTFPRTYPELAGTTAFAMALVSVVVFFVSLLLHELGHAVQAQRDGMEIDGITLLFFGGVAKFKGMFPSAGAEFRIAIAGPAVTAVLIGVFAGTTAILNGLDAPAYLTGVSDYLARINGILLAFNMVPALPLDGGRVFRSYLWHRQKNFTAATVSAAKGGRAFGIVLIAVGVLGLFSNAGPYSLVFALLGWFLMQAAQSETAFAQLRGAMHGLRVRDLMTPEPDVVGPRRSVKTFIDGVARARGRSTYPVVERGRLLGLVSLRIAALVPPDERSTKTVRDVMVALDRVETISPGADVLDAIAALQGGVGRAVVVDDGKVVGILSRADIARAMELDRIRGPREVEPAARRTPRIVWVVIGAIIIGAGGLLYSPPYVVIAPGRSFDVSDGIHIEGKANGVNGGYLLTSVQVEQPTGLGLALALIRSREIVPLSAVVPRETRAEDFIEQQQTLFRETRMVAAAAAAKAAGLEVKLMGTGAEIISVLRGSPAAEVFEVGDVITAVDGQPVQLGDDIGRVVRARPSGSTFRVTIDRGGQSRDVDVRSREGIIEGRPGIGIAVGTRDFSIDLPFEVRFDDLEIGGPSAGVTYAMAIYDILTADDLARGRDIASTGEIDLEGRVGPVGGVEEKSIAADRAGADLFLVPEIEVNQARGSGLDIHGINTLAEAIAFLLRGA